MTLVSAHRGGAGLRRALEGTPGALEHACALGVDLVELDVRVLADGTAVVHHDDVLRAAGRRRRLDALDLAAFRAARPDVLTLDETLDRLRGRAGAHLDLKGDARAGGPGGWAALVARAVDRLGTDVVVTSSHDEVVSAVRGWSAGRAAGLHVGLSVRRAPVRTTRAAATAHLRRRLVECDATLVVAHHGVAALPRLADALGLPLLAWTVDDERGLARWLDGAAWAVVTNRPEVALEVRTRLDR